MELHKQNKTKKRKLIHDLTKKRIEQIVNFGDGIIMSDKKTHQDFVNYLLELLEEKKFVDTIYQKLTANPIAKELYNYLIWKNNTISTQDAKNFFSLTLRGIAPKGYYDTEMFFLDNEFGIIKRLIEQDWRGVTDILILEVDFIPILKLFFPKPADYELTSVENPKQTLYTYDNSHGVLQFINTIEQMLQNHLVEFGKANEKPLAKTLNILKTTSGTQEFYTQKKLDTLVTDMLTRGFYYYYLKTKKFKPKEYDTLKDFARWQFDNQLDFFISRVLVGHLKKVRFDFYYSSQNKLFDTTKLIINNLISKEWVSVENIINFTIYRKLELNIESSYKTREYYMEGTQGRVTGEYHYYEIYYEPMIKGILFYLGALGVLELRYDDPLSSYENIAQKGSSFISPWDRLEYVKLTQLGLYLLGEKQTYEAKEIQQKQTTIKFDEYKPIITIEKTDTITLAKVEPFVEKYEENRYILSYSKVFRDCKTYKALLLKIESFYKLFNTPLPKVFDQYFDEIKANANMLKKDLKLITIELQNNKKLLHLFMTNKKLQEITIKASGYRVVVAKDDLPKLTKIVKDHGFFIEF